MGHFRIDPFRQALWGAVALAWCPLAAWAQGAPPPVDAMAACNASTPFATTEPNAKLPKPLRADALALDARYADAAERWQDYGVTRVGAFTDKVQGLASPHWRLWAPTARRVWVCLYPSSQAPASQAVPLQRDEPSGSWHGHALIALPHQTNANRATGGTLPHYTDLVEVPVAATGWVLNRVTDPYSLSLNANSQRSAVIDLDDDALKPRGWTRMPPARRIEHAVDLVVYELHLRDFSLSDTSVPAADRGKYLAFTHARSRGMRHLRQLARAGVTDLHLLPVFDIASVPEQGCVNTLEVDDDARDASAGRHCFNWGYDPLHFNAPEGSYASKADDAAARVLEFRRMVMGLRRAGLRVGMDVVYNHTAASGQRAQSVLDRIVPGYYHRLNQHGEVERSTCCDNTATEHRMMGKLMRDSLAVWVKHYGIESFRFDLMGHQPRALMEQAKRELHALAGREIHFIGEGWNFGEVANNRLFQQASQTELGGTGIATFNDRLRDAARGGGCCDEGDALVTQTGWLNTPGPRRQSVAMAHANTLVRIGLAGSLRDMPIRQAGHVGNAAQAAHRIDYTGQPAGYAHHPGEVVNYVENHDNPTLFDVNALKLPIDASPQTRARVQALGSALVLLAQGIPYLHAGQELMRSKSLDRNSFASGDRINQLDWSMQSNHFGDSQPPGAENQKNQAWITPRLAQRHAIAPSPALIRHARDATLALLRLRSQLPHFRLRTRDEVIQRVSFPPEDNADPELIVLRIDGQGLAGANQRSVVVAFNASSQAKSFGIEGVGLGRHARPVRVVKRVIAPHSARVWP